MRNLIRIEAQLSNLPAGGGVVGGVYRALKQEPSRPTGRIALDVRRGRSRATLARLLRTLRGWVTPSVSIGSFTYVLAANQYTMLHVRT